MAQSESADALSGSPIVEESGKLSWVRIFLSIFLVFHLSVIMLIPNSENLLGARLAPYVEPYVSFFEFSNRWSFFAPEPGPPPVYMEWELLGAGGSPIETGRMPELNNPYFLRERYNRRLAAVEFMMTHDTRAEKIMVPYLCGIRPDVSSVRLWKLAYSIPSRDEITSRTRTIGDDVSMNRQLVTHSFCDSLSGKGGL